jgi:hypothetical protein
MVPWVVRRLWYTTIMLNRQLLSGMRWLGTAKNRLIWLLMSIEWWKPWMDLCRTFSWVAKVFLNFLMIGNVS